MSEPVTMDIADAELIWPGYFVDHPEPDEARSAFSLLQALDTAFLEALLSLIYFADALRRSVTESGKERWEYDMAERREAEEAAWIGRPDPMFSIDDHDAMRAAVEEKRIEGERELTRRRWARGELPRSVAHHLPFIYAKSFVFALDSIEKLLTTLSKSPVPTSAAVAVERFTTTVPGVKHVRDTVHHTEDRVRGLDRHGRPIDLKPIENNFIKAPGGVLVLNSLNGTRYGCTVEDGRYIEVDVTPATLLAARDAIQEVLNSVAWRNLDRHRSPIV